MNILLDECVPWPIHKILIGHECSTAQQRGWGGIKNGDLLKRAEGEFDLFITADRTSSISKTFRDARFRFSRFPRTSFGASWPPLL
jgi:hypothetical protein